MQRWYIGIWDGLPPPRPRCVFAPDLSLLSLFALPSMGNQLLGQGRLDGPPPGVLLIFHSRPVIMLGPRE